MTIKIVINNTRSLIPIGVNAGRLEVMKNAKYNNKNMGNIPHFMSIWGIIVLFTHAPQYSQN